jgi:hypothetical protein
MEGAVEIVFPFKTSKSCFNALISSVSPRRNWGTIPIKETRIVEIAVTRAAMITTFGFCGVSFGFCEASFALGGEFFTTESDSLMTFPLQRELSYWGDRRG